MVSIDKISVEFGATPLLTDISFVVSPRDRIALVGKNGAGKSTLLKLIAGEQQPTSGGISRGRDVSIGYLPQVMVLADERTVREEAETAFAHVKEIEARISRMEAEVAERSDYESDEYMELVERLAHEQDHYQMIGGNGREAEIERTLTGLGFRRSDLDRPTKEFSGGWRMRIELAKLLLQNPDLLLLDEPTNHLDIGSIQWLEQFLLGRSGALVLVSHDRTFINNVTNRTIEITCHRINDYKVKYDQYVQLRDERRQTQLRAYENQQREIAEARDFIERFRYKPTKSNQVQSRIKMLEKMVPVEVDEIDTSQLHLRFPPCQRSGDFPIICEDVAKNYGQQTVFEGVNLSIRRGEKVAFVGNNGEGKTTLVKCIMNEIPFDGKLTIAQGVQIGYFAQNQAQLLDGNLTVYDTIDRVARGEIRNKLRDLLGAFMFGGAESDKFVRVLSGGERSRLAMIRLLLQPVNLLILDEPTNHLDMASKDVLKQAVQQFDGTAIIVSHDRDFLDGLVDKIYVFGQQHVREHLGTLAELQLINQTAQAVPNAQTTQTVRSTQAPPTYAALKEQQKQVRKAEKRVAECEAAIDRLEKDIADVEAKLSTPEGAADSTLFVRHADLQKRLDAAMEQWETAGDELAQLRQNI